MVAMFSAGGSSTATILPVDGPERLIFRGSISDMTVLSTGTSPGSGDHYISPYSFRYPWGKHKHTCTHQ